MCSLDGVVLLITFMNFSFSSTPCVTGARGLAFGLSYLLTWLHHFKFNDFYLLIFSERCMTLPIIWILRGRYSGINWPNFNIVVSQGIWWPEERERGRVVKHSETHTTLIKFFVLYGCIFGVPKLLQKYIKDHWSQITIRNEKIKKSSEYVRITKTWHMDAKWTNAVGKIMLMDLVDAGFQKASIGKNLMCAKHRKQKATKWDMYPLWMQ